MIDLSHPFRNIIVLKNLNFFRSDQLLVKDLSIGTLEIRQVISAMLITMEGEQYVQTIKFYYNRASLLKDFLLGQPLVHSLTTIIHAVITFPKHPAILIG